MKEEDDGEVEVVEEGEVEVGEEVEEEGEVEEEVEGTGDGARDAIAKGRWGRAKLPITL